SDSAEYALLVRDDWQHRGVGGALTRRCLEIAAGRGLRRVVSRTTAANVGMLALLRRYGFVISRSVDGIWVEGIWPGREEKS
ncbi:MAG TPA: GNAT family N-acetyltransferase, partial [Candidatus Aminicenantes bacterium]|nr:GNAT family N-acetyltransferase [Candidatus Aminicenantes bacterium]